MTRSADVLGRVIVVGAINVDLMIKANDLPRPGETVVGHDVVVSGGGKGANAAVAAARTGASVFMVGAVGADVAGENAVRDLREAGVDVSHVIVEESAATGTALIVVSADGENQIAVGPGANSVLSGEAVSEAMKDIIGTADSVLVSTEIPESAVRAAISSAISAGVTCVLNPAPVLPWVAELVLEFPVLLTPNRRELSELAFAVRGEKSKNPPAGARSLWEVTLQPVVVTLGSEGVVTVTSNGDSFGTPALVVEAKDTTGAGDTFNGVFAAGLASGLDLGSAVELASGAASRSVQHLGARAS